MKFYFFLIYFNKFDDIDSNKDGLINRKEFDQYVDDYSSFLLIKETEKPKKLKKKITKEITSN